MSAVTNSARPIAAIRTSAWRARAGRPRVWEWQTVTVALAPAFFCSARRATGLPTRRLRPMTTTCRPASRTPERARSSMMPAGVQLTNPVSSSCASLPRLTVPSPSTSLAGAIRRKTASSSRCGGSGDCTRMPSTAGSPLSWSIRANNSSEEIVAGGRRIRPAMPIAAAVFSLFLT